MSDFFRKHGMILSEVFWYMEKSKNLEKKIFHKCAKTDGMTVETRSFRYQEI